MSDLKNNALHYHQYPRPGKLEVVPTKALSSQRDLSLAYTPGVAFACEAIVDDPRTAADYTARGNLVAVITNGTAVLGLGDIGPLASKPVMEGKAVLFKKFAGIDVFDIEVAEKDIDRLVDIIAALEPTFGAINLEDIKAPECFYVEEKLKSRLKIPVFHDDQHGTAIIAAAFALNALEVVGKELSQIKLVCSGAGAAAIACVDLLVGLGLNPDHILMVDRKGVIYQGRTGLDDPFKQKYAAHTTARTLDDAMTGADVFLGVSSGGLLSGESVKKMAPRPIIMALANPTPEILPEVVHAARDDAIMATGRSDYPNQVNNVLCFPFIFRGALDVGATQINAQMKLACVYALADLARREVPDVVAAAYGEEHIQFGPNYLIPKPFDNRLLIDVASAVAKAAMDSGVATRPITDFEAYRAQLGQYVSRAGLTFKPIIDRVKSAPVKKRIVYTEGEDPKILRAVQTVVDEGLAHPILVGRREVVQMRLDRLGLRLKIDQDFELCDPTQDVRYKEYWATYYHLMARQGVSPELAKVVLRTNTTVIAALMVHRGEADAVIVSPVQRFEKHMQDLLPILGRAPSACTVAALDILVTRAGTHFICDTHVNEDPTAAELAEIVMMAADQVRSFGITPRVALISHSQFGSSNSASARKMQDVLERVQSIAPDLEIDGEMHADAALDAEIRTQAYPDSPLRGSANLLVMPNLDAAHIAFNMAKILAEGEQIGPILLGLGKPAHILPFAATARTVVDMTALVAADVERRHSAQAVPSTNAERA